MIEHHEYVEKDILCSYLVENDYYLIPIMEFPELAGLLTRLSLAEHVNMLHSTVNTHQYGYNLSLSLSHGVYVCVSMKTILYKVKR